MDTVYLLKALELAKKRRGFCSPNPSVGAVLVKAGNVLAEGLHWAAGKEHAEVKALEGIEEDLSSATLYVTLEPCCHFGRTPPCTDLILKRQVGRVVYAFRDSNPVVSGGGHRQLLDAGVEVAFHPLAEIDEFYRSYAHWRRTGLPRVTAKLAISLNGKSGSATADRLLLSGEKAAEFTHQNRHVSDALLTTAKTINLDNPLLNARVGTENIAKPLYVLDSQLELSPTSQVFFSSARLTVLAAEDAPADRRGALEAAGARVVMLPSSQSRPSLDAAFRLIGEEGVHDLWVECGGTLFQSLAQGGFLHRAYLYLAPEWIGESAQSAFGQSPFSGVKAVRWSVLGRDALLEMEW